MTFGNITVIGSLIIDHIFLIDRLPNLGESYEAPRYKKALGGKGANAAIAAYRSCRTNPNAEPSEKLDTNIDVRMIGAVGEDADGTWMRQELEKAKVDISGVRVEPTKTGMSFIMVEEPKSEDGSGQQPTRDNRLIYTIGANATLQPAQFHDVASLSNGNQPDLIISQLEIARETVETILKTAHSAGIKVLLNAAPVTVMVHDSYHYIRTSWSTRMRHQCFMAAIVKT